LSAAPGSWKSVVGIGIGIAIGSRNRFLGSRCLRAIAKPIPIPTAVQKALKQK
jgi:hypothetical protein